MSARAAAQDAGARPARDGAAQLRHGAGGGGDAAHPGSLTTPHGLHSAPHCLPYRLNTTTNARTLMSQSTREPPAVPT